MLDLLDVDDGVVESESVEIIVLAMLPPMLQAGHDCLYYVRTAFMNPLPNLQILKPFLRMRNAHRRLPANHVPGDLSMRVLTLLTSSSRFALPRRWTASDTNALVV